MAAEALRLAQGIMPMAAGLAISLFAFVSHRILANRADAFDIEMKNASLELANDLSLFFRAAKASARVRGTAENGVDE